jgi:hypothetical protein
MMMMMMMMEKEGSNLSGSLMFCSATLTMNEKKAEHGLCFSNGHQTCYYTYFGIAI